MSDLSDEFNLEAHIENAAKAKMSGDEMREHKEKVRAFIECCQTETVQDVDEFIKKHPELDANDTYIKLLFFTGKANNWDVVKHLIEKHNCNPHENNETLLYQAAKTGNLAMVEYLVKEHGANIHADNDCAFRHACLREHHGVVEFLLEQGADATKISSEGPWETARVTCDAVVEGMSKKTKVQKEKVQQTKQNKIQQINILKIKSKTGYKTVRRRPKIGAN